MEQPKGYGRRLVVSGSVGLLLVLGSCTTDDPGPGQTNQSSPGTEEPTATGPTGGPTATATSTAPEVEKPTPPDAMRRDDVAGAEAAAQYFLQLYPYVYATGDLTEWEAMSHPDCVFCRSVIDNVDELHSSGGHGEGGEIRIESSVAANPAEGNEYFGVDLKYEEGPSVLIEADGTERDPETGGAAIAYFALGQSDEGWHIREVTIEAVSRGDG